MIRYTCAKCGEKLETDDCLSAKEEVCPVCRHVNAVPMSRAEARHERRECRAIRATVKRARRRAQREVAREQQAREADEVDAERRAHKEADRARPLAARELLGLAGALLLVMGVFAPFAQVPIMGSISHFHNGEGDGVFVLILGFLSIGLAVSKRCRGLLVTGVASLGLVAFTVYNVQARLAKIAIAGAGFGWGVGVLVAGAVLLLVSAGMPEPIVAAAQPAVELETVDE